MGRQFDMPGSYVDDSELEGEFDALMNELKSESIPSNYQVNTSQVWNVTK
jgi:hypothetical protein